MPVSDAQFAGVITLSMPTPFWDPIVGTLGGVLDPKVVISRLNTEWSRRQGLTSTGKGPDVVFQTGTWPKCENCHRTGHVKAKCWAKGGGQEGQYPKRYNSQTVNSFTDTPIVWTYGSRNQPDVWFADSAATIHVSTNRKDFTSYCEYNNERSINAFGNNLVKGAGEGDINVEVECKTTRI